MQRSSGCTSATTSLILMMKLRNNTDMRRTGDASGCEIAISSWMKERKSSAMLTGTAVMIRMIRIGEGSGRGGIREGESRRIRSWTNAENSLKSRKRRCGAAIWKALAGAAGPGTEGAEIEAENSATAAIFMIKVRI